MSAPLLLTLQHASSNGVIQPLCSFCFLIPQWCKNAPPVIILPHVSWRPVEVVIYFMFNGTTHINKTHILCATCAWHLRNHCKSMKIAGEMSDVGQISEVLSGTSEASEVLVYITIHVPPLTYCWRPWVPPSELPKFAITKMAARVNITMHASKARLQ